MKNQPTSSGIRARILFPIVFLIVLLLGLVAMRLDRKTMTETAKNTNIPALPKMQTPEQIPMQIVPTNNDQLGIVYDRGGSVTFASPSATPVKVRPEKELLEEIKKHQPQQQ